MLKFVAHLFSATFDLTDEDRRRSVRIAAWVAVVLVVIILIAAGATAGNVVPADHPIWEAVLQTRLALVRLVLAVPIVVIGATLAVVMYQLLENSKLGDRVLGSFFVKAPDGLDDSYFPEDGKDFALAESGNCRSTILAALFLACILGLLIGVLR